LLLLLLAGGCAPAQVVREPERVRPPVERTCLVLSVGGAKGLAHLGAIDALKEDGVAIDCVFGNSMGSLVGSLYATAPEQSVERRYRALLGAYEQETKSDAGFAAFLAGLGTYLLWGDANIGAGLAMSAADRMSVERFRNVYDTWAGSPQIDALPVPFGTSYQMVQGDGLTMITPRDGSLAKAVSGSIANPFVFADVNVKKGPLDPGGDRMAAVPVEDAWQTFKPTRILVLNVTGEPAVFTKRVGATVDEVMIDFCPPEPEAMRGSGIEFERARRAGYEQTKEALARFRSGAPAERGYLGAVVASHARGAEVVAVSAGSPAEAAGLVGGDIVSGVGASEVRCSADLVHGIGRLNPGTPATLRVLRGDAPMEVPLVVGVHPVQPLR
jgi:NTE family protein